MPDLMIEAPPPLGERLLSLILRLRVRKPRLGNLPTGLLRIDAPWQVIAMTAIAGLCGTGIVALLNSPAAFGGDQDDVLWHGLMFVLLLLLYGGLQRALLRRTSAAVEAALDRQRTAVAAKVLHLNLQRFEALPREQLQGGLARHYEAISEAMVGILTGLQSFVLLVLTLVYLAFLSPLAALLSAGVFVILIQAYLSKRAELAQRMRAAAVAESGLAGGLAELLDGFKELRLDSRKRAAVLETVSVQSTRSGMERAVTASIFADVIVFSNSMAYLMGGAVVFVLPILSNMDSAQLPSLVAVVLFLIGPMGAAVGAAKQLATARFSITALMEFEALLDTLQPPAEAQAPLPAFHSLRAEGLGYAHRPQVGDTVFRVGPIDFEVTAGEVIFITGGNGSGKTTALRVAIGLYPPTAGHLVLNGAPVAESVQEGDLYRELFGAVFADAYLFRRPYGLSDAQVERFRQELEQFGIAGKLPADLREGIDPRALSTGQRKRLALALALAEGRPVLVLDEWAADQDPQSREAFYRVLLPRLRAEGKAVIAITHDDRYFDAADRRYHMEDGRMTLVPAG